MDVSVFKRSFYTSPMHWKMHVSIQTRSIIPWYHSASYIRFKALFFTLLEDLVWQHYTAVTRAVYCVGVIFCSFMLFHVSFLLFFPLKNALRFMFVSSVMQGYALLCVGFPSSDLEVETQDEDEVKTNGYNHMIT